MGAPDESTEVLPTSPSSAPPRPGRSDTLIGRRLGKFTLVETLGRGGSGDVYRAEEAELGRSVVVKVLRQGLARQSTRAERFLREVKLASRLDHPYAAHVYAYGAEADAVVWIAMEHVRGVTLDGLVAARGAMPPSLFGPLFARLCEVVHTAHELGIVHRDIKGSNVMVIERAGQMLPKLLDFGIAKGMAGEVADGAAGGDDALTGHGAMLGSPQYMAPEQWTSAADVDRRADIYALGVLAYLCVAGRLPFHGLGRAQLAAAHRDAAPPPLPPSVPRGVAAAIERALAKAPDARWPDALAFAAAMHAAIGVSVPETVPLLDPVTRDTWATRGPQPVADAVVRLARATTTVDADAAVHALVAISCRWFAVVALAQLRAERLDPTVREHARAVAGRDEATPWLRLARAAAAAAAAGLDGLAAALAATTALEQLALRCDDRDRSRTATALAEDIAALPAALRPLEPLLDYHLVVGRTSLAESWCGARRRDRDPVVVWGAPLAPGEVALLDRDARVVTRLSPLVQVSAPLPSAEPELFLLWRTARGAARLVAAPWGYERDDDAAAHWLAALTTAHDDTAVDTDDDPSPYPGLAAYAADDARHFVGREREVGALVNRLVGAPLVAVLDASGAGKTSFLHAGVIPRLGDDHDVMSLRPGRHPWRVLAEAGESASEAAASDDAALVDRLRARGERAVRGLVIVVDQLEEVMTLCTDPAERERFASVLARAASDRESPVRVVVGLRDDFASVVETLAAFRGRFETYVLATPAPDALRRIITEPARRAQVVVDEGVVEDMVREVGGRAGSLPLLSFTAAQLWQTRDRTRRRITHAAYTALGGVAGALSTYADQVYASLDERDRTTVRDLFARLVAPDGTRIPIPRAELEQLPGAAGVVSRLIDARLLVAREDAGVDVVEIVHECLATRWERLVRWRSDDAADRVLVADVRAAARRWAESGHPPDLLWRGEALAELRRLAARTTSLTAGERAFAHASDRAVRRRRLVRRGVIAGVMLALAIVAGGMAYLRDSAEASAHEARAAARLAEERLTTSLVAQGRRELNDGRGLAALAYFREALARGADTPALRFMIGVAARAWPDEELVRVRSGTTATVILPAGFITGDDQGRLAFWSDDTKPLGQLALEVGPITKLVRDGEQVLALGERGVAVVDPAARTSRHQVKLEQRPYDALLGPAAGELAVVLDPGVVIVGLDGVERRRHDITGADDAPELGRGASHAWFAMQGRPHVLDLRTMQRRSLGGPLKFGPRVCPDRTTVLTLTPSHDVGVLDADGTVRLAFKAENEPLYVTCSASGDQVGAVSTSSAVVHDKRGARTHIVTFNDSDKEAGVVRLVGNDVWTASLDGVIRRYRDNLLVASMPILANRVAELRVSERRVIARGDDSTLVVMRAQASQLETVDTGCRATALMMADAAVGVICGDEMHVYIGRQRIGTTRGAELAHAALEPGSLRGAIQGRQLRVFDPTAGQLATSGAHAGPIAFEDRDRLLVGEGATLWRWTFATDAWERAIELEPAISAVAVVDGRILVGTESKQLFYVAAGRVEHRVRLRGPVASLAVSADGQRVSAQLAGGATAILDANGRVLRELEPSDAVRVTDALDPTGALIARPRRGTLSIWDTATGDVLLYQLDLFRYAVAPHFAADGRLEFAGSEVGTIAIAPERRPVAELVRALDCRVPLRVAGSRLEPREVTCE